MILRCNFILERSVSDDLKINIKFIKGVSYEM